MRMVVDFAGAVGAEETRDFAPWYVRDSVDRPRQSCRIACAGFRRRRSIAVQPWVEPPLVTASTKRSSIDGRDLLDGIEWNACIAQQSVNSGYAPGSIVYHDMKAVAGRGSGRDWIFRQRVRGEYAGCVARDRRRTRRLGNHASFEIGWRVAEQQFALVKESDAMAAFGFVEVCGRGENRYALGDQFVEDSPEVASRRDRHRWSAHREG